MQICFKLTRGKQGRENSARSFIKQEERTGLGCLAGENGKRQHVANRIAVVSRLKLDLHEVPPTAWLLASAGASSPPVFPVPIPCAAPSRAYHKVSSRVLQPARS